MVTFSQIPDDIYQNENNGRWISQKLVHEKFEYYLMLEIVSLGYTPEYMVSLSIVSPNQLKKCTFSAVENIWGKDILLDEIKLADALYLVGVYVPVFIEYGTDHQKLLETAKQNIPDATAINHYMNKIVEGRSITGWDLLGGKTICNNYED